jgi:type IV pilus assembly protein PilE
MFARGITLLELLVVLVIVGALAALAVPVYQRHVMRVNRVEAITELQRVLSAQERFHLRHGRYAADVRAAAPEGLGLAPASRFYSLSLSLAADGQTFIATASPLPGRQVDDEECMSFSMDQRGRRAVSGRGGVEKCWR